MPPRSPQGATAQPDLSPRTTTTRLPARLVFRAASLALACGLLLAAGAPTLAASTRSAPPHAESLSRAMADPAPIGGADPTATTLSGVVLDLATGRPIAGARVRTDGIEATSDATGAYRLSVPAGDHTVRIEAAGYGGATAVDWRRGPLDVGLPPLVVDDAGAHAMALRLHAAARFASSDAGDAGDATGLSPEGSGTADPQAVAGDPQSVAGAAGVTALAQVVEVPRTIRVLMPDGLIQELETDDYLKGVVPHEMGYIFRRGAEALKAQAIASRTYAATTCLAASAGDPAVCEPGLDANVDTTTRTQVWRPVHYDLTDAAVEATHGQVAVTAAGMIRALFFARTAGRTLDSEASNCCGGNRNSYLRSVSSPDPFDVRWGHGAGMSQEGAAVLAAWGATAEEILAHYYTGVRITPIGPPRLYDAGVAPREGTTEDVFEFRVGYADPDDDPPAVKSLVIDGVARELTGPTDEATDYRLGASYALTSTLPVGEHAVRFRFTDGFDGTAELDAGSVKVTAPLPAPGGRPAVPESLHQDVEPEAAGAQSGSVAFGAAQLTPVVVPGQPGAGAESAVPGDLATEGGTVVAPTAPKLLFESPIAQTEFGFMAVGARWQGRVPAGAHVDVLVRASRDGTAWSDWMPLYPEDTDVKAPAAGDESWTGLLIARGRFLQARALAVGVAAVTETVGAAGAERSASVDPPTVEGLTLFYYNTDAGPSADSAATEALRKQAAQAGSAPQSEQAGPLPQAAPGGLTSLAAEPVIIDRAGWGADEKLRLDASGREIWPVAMTVPLAQIVHHTVTTNDPADAAAVMRAIYQYHAVTKAWGDIGYNYLIDQRGRIFQGRFGGERDGKIAQGGHALQYNPNTIGIALLGTFETVRPAAAAESALSELMAWRGVRYNIEPPNPVTLAGTRFAYSVMGHRDALPGHTACPGDSAYGRLPTIRNAVVARMAEIRAANVAPSPRPPTPVPPTATPRPPTATATPRPPTLRPTATPTPRPPTATRTATAPPAPVNCASLIQNGGFEVEDTLWLRNRAYFTRYEVFRGVMSMFVGLRDTDPDVAASYASVEQSVRMPERVGTARLTFYARSVGEDADRRIVRLMNAQGGIIGLLSTIIPSNSTFQPFAYDVTAALAAQAGKDIRVYFGVVNNGNGVKSYMRLDDVQLQVCPAPGVLVATPTPEATSNPGPTSTPRAANATATPDTFDPPTPAPPSPTRVRPTPTVGPVVVLPEVICRNVLENGGFEAADLAGWEASGGHRVGRVQEAARTGAGGLRLGLTDPVEDGFDYAAIAQPFLWPAGVVTATLTLGFRLDRVDPADAFVIELRRPGDGLRRVLAGPQLGAAPDGWRELRLEIPPAGLDLAGRATPLSLYMAVLNRGQGDVHGAVTAVSVDDVQLETCAKIGRWFLPMLGAEPGGRQDDEADARQNVEQGAPQSIE